MKQILVILCGIFWVQCQTILPAVYVTPAVTHRINQNKLNTKNVFSGKPPTQKAMTDQVPVFYVTAKPKGEKGKREALINRKSRAFPPSTSYGVPLYQALPSVGLSTSFSSQSEETQKKQPPQSRYLPPSTSYGVPIPPQEQPVTHNESNSIEEPNATEAESENKGYDYPKPDDQIVVNKNVYFYKAPQDFEVHPTVKPIKLPKPQKNYKLIFIKAPSAPVPPPVVQVAPQNEEKTLVYVLVKKPDEQPELIIPTPPTTQPSKPEVYFVKYSAKSERVETAEKMYGVPQYGKGYYYGEGKSDSVSSDEESKSEETVNNEHSILPQYEEENYQSEQNETSKKKRSSVRGVRSSSFSGDDARNELKGFGNYFSKPEQRRRAFE